MRKFFLLTVIPCFLCSAENSKIAPPSAFEEEVYADKIEEVPYFENGKIIGTRKVDTTVKPGKMIKSGQTINKLETTGFRVASLDNGANNPFGLLPSDVVLEADGVKMTSLKAAQEFFVNSGHYKEVKVLRDGKEISLTKK